jgi:hypothetical protein
MSLKLLSLFAAATTSMAAEKVALQAYGVGL